jgi:hypothetical protein
MDLVRQTAHGMSSGAGKAQATGSQLVSGHSAVLEPGAQHG